MDQLAQYEYRPATPAAVAALCMVMLSCMLGLSLSFVLFPPTAWRGDVAVAVGAAELLSTIQISGLMAALSSEDLFRELAPRLIGVALA
ncbi:MAG: hypothetical protein ACREEK_22700, partial [Bradyrhizobium sp.]